MDSYNSKNGAGQYIEFMESDSGKFEQEILPRYILPLLGADVNQTILDAGCGTGWLTDVLAAKFKNVVGCDASAELINYAKKNYPGRTFAVCDITKPLPFAAEHFDAVMANMSLHDTNNVSAALKNFNAALKSGGKLIITISNPYYSLPVGVWKRGLFGKILLKKPRLLLKPYFYFKNKTLRRFNWGSSISSNFYTLPEYISWVLAAGFELVKLDDIQAETDSKKFNLQYQLHRFPYILLLEFHKRN
jgi:SAM-dependent methyltransferase